MSATDDEGDGRVPCELQSQEYDHTHNCHLLVGTDILVALKVLLWIVLS
jgi:hypothetical protein